MDSSKIMAAIQKIKEAADELHEAVSGTENSPKDSDMKMESSESVGDKKSMFISMMKKKAME